MAGLIYEERFKEINLPTLKKSKQTHLLHKLMNNRDVTHRKDIIVHSEGGPKNLIGHKNKLRKTRCLSYVK